MNPTTSLKPRLNAIFKIIEHEQKSHQYPYIWDCCCDHGYLGIKILHEDLCDRLFFVDQLAHIINQLERKLSPFDKGSHQTIIADAAQLNFSVDEKHLVILAGIGGDVSQKIVSGIEENNSQARIDYIFCPSSRQKALRAYLISLGLGLIDEKLVYENKRYYEILFVQGKSSLLNMPVVTAECELWEEDNEDHQRYLKKISMPRTSKKPNRKKRLEK